MEKITCSKCGVAFPQLEGDQDVCLKCIAQEDGGAGMKVKDIMAVLQAQVDESKAKDEPLTISELAGRTNIDEDTIWLFIRVGKLGSMSLNDPKVQEYLQAMGRHKTTSQRRRKQEDIEVECASMKDKLLILKRQVRECNAIDEFLTVSELSSCTDIPEGTIWHFIRTGDLDTVSLDDPKVREFLLERRRKIEAQRRKTQEETGKQEPSESSSKGFYHKNPDDKG